MNRSWQPTDSQERLLEACLLAGERAATALRAWQRTVELQKLDDGSYRLLPLLASRSNVLGIEPEFRALIKGVYRRTWYHNQLLLAEARKLTQRLDEAGIPVMALKGAALTLRNYRDAGARPMRDIDLAVPVEHAEKAVRLLVDAGWTPEPTPLTGTMTPTAGKAPGWRPGPRPLEAFNDCYFGVRHAHGFTGRGGIGIDLHWHLFQGNCDGAADIHAWQEAIPNAEGSTPLLLPSDHEHLVLILAHASRWNPAPSVRWVADAVTLLRTSPELDWDAFVAAAIRRQTTLAALELLTYLHGRFDVSIPDRVLSHLRQHPVPNWVRRAYRRAVSRPTLLTGWSELCYLRDRHRILRREFPGSCPRGFLRFLCGILGADRSSQLMGYIGREGCRRLRGIR